MARKNYIIEYTIEDKSRIVIKHGKMKVKNKENEIEAQIKFEAYLKKKYSNFGQLIVHKCSVDNSFNNIFGDIFNKKNPFSSF